MNNKKKAGSWVITAVVFMAILLLAYFFISSNKQFQVVYASEHQIPGYEKADASIRVYASPQLNKQTVPTGWIIAGWIFFALIAFGTRYVYKNDAELSKTTGTPWKKIAFIFGPILFCMICWFAGYSSRNDLGSYVGKFEDFKKEFQVSESTATRIQKEGGSGNLLIRDENGKLTQWFKDNRK
jgi:hypothetical protein